MMDFFEILIRILQILVVYIFIKKFMGFKHKSASLILIPLWVIYESLTVALHSYVDSPVFNILMYLSYTLLCSIILGRGTIKRKIIYVFSFCAVVAIVQIMIMVIFDIIGIYKADIIDGSDENIPIIFMFIENFIEILIIGGAGFVIGRKEYIDVSIGYWIRAFGISLICLASVVVLGVEITVSGEYRSFDVVFLFLICIIVYISFYFYESIEEKSRIEAETNAYRVQTYMCEEWYKKIEKYQKEIRAVKHDINNHLSVLLLMCQRREDYDEMQKSLDSMENYIKQIGVTSLNDKSVINSGDIIIDSILNLKIASAKSKDIYVKWEVCIDSKFNIKSVDIVIILANLLDNAIEACEKLHISKRTLEIFIKSDFNSFFVSIENGYDGLLDDKEDINIEDIIKTTKKNKKEHGFGINNIMETVKKYQGYMEISAHNNIFTVDIILYTN